MKIREKLNAFWDKHDIDILNGAMGLILVGSGICLGYCLGFIASDDISSGALQEAANYGIDRGVESTIELLKVLAPEALDKVDNALIVAKENGTYDALVDSVYSKVISEVYGK